MTKEQSEMGVVKAGSGGGSDVKVNLEIVETQ